MEITVEIEPQPAALDFKNQFFNQFLLSSPYSFDSTVYFDSVVQRQFGLVSYVIMLKEFISLFTKETGKDTFSLLMRAVAEEKML